MQSVSHGLVVDRGTAGVTGGKRRGLLLRLPSSAMALVAGRELTGSCKQEAVKTVGRSAALRLRRRRAGLQNLATLLLVAAESRPVQQPVIGRLGDALSGHCHVSGCFAPSQLTR